MNLLQGELKSVNFPADFSPTHQKNTPASTKAFVFNITGSLYQRVVKLANGSDVRLHMILTAAYVELLGRYTGSDDILTGIPVYRQEKEGEYINSALALRNRLANDRTFKQLLLQARQMIVEANKHQNYPIETLVKKLGLNLDGETFPLFDTAILLTNVHEKSYLAHIPLNTLFAFHYDEETDTIECRVDYNGNLYLPGSIQRFCRHFTTLLEQAVSQPQALLREIDLLSPEESESIVHTFNRTANEWEPGMDNLASLFEAQAERTPDRIACIDVDEHLFISYGELDRLSSEAAAGLWEHGVGPEKIVAILERRNSQLLIWLLAVIKAGGAFIPIDPATPPKRIRAMLADARPFLIITNSGLWGKYFLPDPWKTVEASAKPYVCVPRGQIKNFDSLPMMDRSLIDYEKYIKFIGVAPVRNCITLQATRGCPYQCAYCSRTWPKTHVFRSGEHIFEEVKMYYDMGFRRFAFVDDIFNLDCNNSERFFRLLIKHKMKLRLFFPSGMRGDILTRDYIDLMVEAGLSGLPLALETASPRLQKLIKKHLHLDRFRQNLDYITQTHPQVILELCTMHGFPSESEEEALMTMDFLLNTKWVHFPYINILKIWPNTEMETLALDCGITPDAIERSENLAYHQLPDILPFEKRFTLEYQSKFLNDYFLSRERLLHVLPHQMKVMTENEMVQKYDSYLPATIRDFQQLLGFLGINQQELGGLSCVPEERYAVTNVNKSLKKRFGVHRADEQALKILVLDVSQYFNSTKGDENVYDVVEVPLGGMFLVTYLHQRFGSAVQGKVWKAGIDYDSFDELRDLLQEFQPDIIGVRALTLYKSFFHQTISLIRQWGLSAPVIAGGPYVTSDCTTVLRDRNIDLAVLGEGELTLGHIVELMLERANRDLPEDDLLKTIPGIAFYEKKVREELLGMPVMCHDVDSPPANLDIPAAGAAPQVSASHLAYIIFTSGSTGRMKGVMLEHKGIANYLQWANMHYFQGKGSNLPLYSSISFDLTLTSLFLPLFTGNAVVAFSGENKDLLTEDVVRHPAISGIKLTPSHLKLLLTQDNHANAVRTIIVGGEELETDLSARAWRHFDQKAEIYNEYGPTEATVGCTVFRFDPTDLSRRGVPIGSPIANMRNYVLDAAGKSMPYGAVGELVVGGHGIARGYLNNPEQTALVFVKDAFSAEAGDRLYKTGDLCGFLPQGVIEYAGRRDHQVKIRGFRIELGEIEAALCRHPLVREAVVIDGKDANGDKYLLGYYIPTDASRESRDLNAGRDVLKLKEFLLVGLPDYMIPSFFIPIDEIPLTVNGKLDRSRLKGPESMDYSDYYVPPEDDYQKRMVALWADLLAVDAAKIGIEANFFDMGGHSLKAVRLVARIQREFLVKVTLADIFECQLLKELAARVRQSARENFVPLEPVEKKDYYALSSAQKRMFVLQRMMGDDTVYNMPYAIPLKEPVDPERLQRTFDALIQRHESLRTVFLLNGDQPVQKVSDNVPFKIEVKEVAESRLAEAKQAFIKPFDLSRPPLLRVCLLKVVAAEPCQVMMFDLHHIINDGVSQDILTYEFFTLMNGGELSPLKFQYKDFSEWQQTPEQQRALERQRNYWLRQFQDGVPVLDLPLDYPRSLDRSYDGETLHFTVEGDQVAALRALTAQTGATMFMCAISAFYILLSRLSGQEDIVVGTAVAARCHDDLQNVIGMFVNTLALRLRPLGDMSISGFLESVKENTLKAFENQEYPFEQLVDSLDLERDTSCNPVFDVIFSFQNLHDRAKLSENKGFADHSGSFKTGYSHSKFDMTLGGRESGQRMIFFIEYCIRLFRRETVSRFIGYFKNILAAYVADPSLKIGEIAMIPEEERRKVLIDWNNTDRDIEDSLTLDRLIARQARETPHRAALVMEDASLTYESMEARAVRFAEELSGCGVRRGDIVAILAHNSIEMMIAVIGLLKIGAPYLGLDPYTPDERVAVILADSAVSAMLINREFSRRVPAEIGCLYLDESAAAMTESPAPTVSFESSIAGDLAYIVYTSGSTGIPKGVMVEHRNAVNYLLWAKERFMNNVVGNWPVFSALSVDFTLTPMFVPIISGYAVHLYRVDRDSHALARIVENPNLSNILVTPSHLRLMKTLPTERSSLKSLMVGGEAFPSGLAAEAYGMFPSGVELFNAYGPSEITVASSSYRLDPEETYGETVPIGFPTANCRNYVLDRHMQPVPVGVAGEIYISGRSVARGYLNRPDITAERFLIDPFNPGQRMYRSGDLGRWTVEGALVHLGRIDSQVKVNGHRIELEEIQSRLVAYDGVESGVVVPQKKENGEVFLCAYIVAAGETKMKGGDFSGLRAFLGDYLPHFMVPMHFELLEVFPMTASGKVDIKALPLPHFAGGGRGSFQAPGNELEDLLADIWRAVLGKESISVHDNFFFSGGDSIKAIQIGARMNKAGYKITIQDIFRSPTIAELAKRMSTTSRIADQQAVVGAMPLLPVQKRFFELYQTSGYHFNMAVMLRWFEPLSEARVREIFGALQAHHDALRITFSKRDGVIEQINRDTELPLRLEVFDLKGKNDARERLADGVNRLQAGFALEAGPLMALGLFYLDDGDRLAVIIHHLVADAFSLRILFEDITTLFRSGPLPLKTDSFKTWAGVVADYAQSPEVKDHLNYWKELDLKGCDVIPRDCEQGGNLVSSCETLSFVLDEQETQSLTSQAREKLLTAIAAGFGQIFGIRRLAVTLEGHGREQIAGDIDVSRTVGWFTTLYPLALETGSGGDVSVLLETVKEALEKIPGNGFTYGLLRYMAGDGSLAGLPAEAEPRVVFNYLGQLDSDLLDLPFRVATESAGDIRPNSMKREFDFEISAMIRDHCLKLSIVYSREQYETGTIAALGKHIETGLRELATAQIRDTEEMYSLSPMQEGMFFHHLYNQDSTAYNGQISYRFKGDLNVEILRRSLWQLFKRHDILRTAFIHSGKRRPLQVVMPRREPELTYQDLRHLPDQRWIEREVALVRDRELKRGFDLEREVLLRVTVLQVLDDEFEFIWMNHHIIMDGWCMGIVMNDLLDMYRALVQGESYSLPPVVPYKNYLQWLERQDREMSIAYWTDYLAGYDTPAALPRLLSPADRESGQQMGRRETAYYLDEETTATLRQWAAAHQVTLNAILQSVWGVVLGRLNGGRDVVFGAVVSGRPTSLPGVESMVGLFINTVPVRVCWSEGQSFDQLARQMFSSSIQGEPHHYCTLADIQAVSELKQGLLNHILVFENYPLPKDLDGVATPKTGKGDSELSMKRMEFFEHSNYDFNILVSLKNRIKIRVNFDSRVYEEDLVEAVLRDVEATVNGILANPDLPVDDIPLSPLYVPLSETDESEVSSAAVQTEWIYKGDYRPAEAQIRASRLMAGYPLLRSSLRLRNGGLALRIHDAGQVVADEAVNGDLVAVIPAGEPPLWRVEIQKLAPREWRFGVSSHPVVLGELSHRLLVAGLLASDNEAGETGPVEDGNGNARYAVSGTEQTVYWTRLFSRPLQPLALAGEFPETQPAGFATVFVDRELEAELLASLRDAVAQLGQEMDVFCLTVFQVLMSKYSGRKDLLVGTRRKPAALAPGMLEKRLAARADCGNDPSFKELLARTAEQWRAQERFGQRALDRFMKQYREVNRLNGDLLAEAVFRFSDDRSLPEPEARFCQAPETVVERPESLLMDCVWQRDGLELKLWFASDCFTKDSASRILDHFVRILSMVVAQPEIQLADIELAADLQSGTAETEKAPVSKPTIQFDF